MTHELYILSIQVFFLQNVFIKYIGLGNFIV